MLQGGVIYVEMCVEMRDGIVWFVFIVVDCGKGMDDVMIDWIFELFFMIKCVGEGIGLGLLIVYGIVQVIGGMIDVDFFLGEGICFEIWWFQMKFG